MSQFVFDRQTFKTFLKILQMDNSKRAELPAKKSVCGDCKRKLEKDELPSEETRAWKLVKKMSNYCESDTEFSEEDESYSDDDEFDSELEGSEDEEDLQSESEDESSEEEQGSQKLVPSLTEK